MIVGVTGHRIGRLRPEGVIDPQLPLRLQDYAVDALGRLEPSQIVTGMALGWDMACAHAAVRLSIPFTAVVPFPGQESRWPSDLRAEYKWLLRQAEDVRFTGVEFSPEVMQKRNEEIVDASDCMAALWDGIRGGGTFKCLEYARNKIRIHQLYQHWTEWRGDYGGLIRRQ